MGNIHILEPSETVGIPTSVIESIGDDLVSQTILCMLDRFVEACTRFVARGSVIEWFHSNRAELFRDLTRVSLTLTEYWIEPTERIINDLDCTPAEKLRGTMSLLRDETYKWWLIVE